MKANRKEISLSKGSISLSIVMTFLSFFVSSLNTDSFADVLMFHVTESSL